MYLLLQYHLTFIINIKEGLDPFLRTEYSQYHVTKSEGQAILRASSTYQDPDLFAA